MQMVQATMATGSKVKSKAMESRQEPTVASTKGSSRRTTAMAKESY